MHVGGGTGGNFGASLMDPISAAVATSVAPPTTIYQSKLHVVYSVMVD